MGIMHPGRPEAGPGGNRFNVPLIRWEPVRCSIVPVPSAGTADRGCGCRGDGCGFRGGCGQSDSRDRYRSGLPVRHPDPGPDPRLAPEKSHLCKIEPTAGRRRRITRGLPAANPRTTRHCFNNARYRASQPAEFCGKYPRQRDHGQKSGKTDRRPTRRLMIRALAGRWTLGRLASSPGPARPGATTLGPARRGATTLGDRRDAGPRHWGTGATPGPTTREPARPGASGQPTAWPRHDPRHDRRHDRDSDRALPFTIGTARSRFSA